MREEREEKEERGERSRKYTNQSAVQTSGSTRAHFGVVVVVVAVAYVVAVVVVSATANVFVGHKCRAALLVPAADPLLETTTDLDLALTARKRN